MSTQQSLFSLTGIAPRRACSILGGLIALGLLVASPCQATTVNFQQGVGGYTQAKDTLFWKLNPNTNYGANTSLAVDAAGDPDEAQSLFQYDGIFGNGAGQIPFGSIINSASFGVFNSSGSAPANGAIHRMLISWDAAVDTWNTFNGGVDNTPSGEFLPIPSYSGPIGGGPFDVTSILQAWSNGASNFGFAFLPITSGGIVFRSSEHSQVIARPILTVDFTVPEPSTLALTAVGTTLFLLRRTRRIASPSPKARSR